MPVSKLVDTFENAAIILETEPAERVEFQVWPDTITAAKSVNWADVNIIGRSEPVKTYQSGTPRTFNFILSFVASVDAGDQGTPEWVKENVNFLESLVYSQQTGITFFPPVVLLLVGDLINSRCVVRSVSVILKGPWSLSERKKIVAQQPGGSRLSVSEEVVEDPAFVSLPLFADVAIQLEEVNLIPDTSSFVRRGR